MRRRHADAQSCGSLATRALRRDENNMMTVLEKPGNVGRGGGFNKCQTGSETSSTLGRADGLGRHREAKQGPYRNGVLVELLMKSSCCSFEDEGSFLGVRII